MKSDDIKITCMNLTEEGKKAIAGLVVDLIRMSQEKNNKIIS